MGATAAVEKLNQSFAQACLSQMLREGFNPGEVIFDGEPHRFYVDSDKPGSLNGWYIALPGGLRVTYGTWKEPDKKYTWQPKATEEMTAEEKAAFEKEIEAANRKFREEQSRKQAEARKEAQRIWEEAKEAPADHPYLVSKGVKPHGLQMSFGKLVMPLHDSKGMIWTLQFIASDSSKKQLTGGRKKGCYYPFGKPQGTIVVVEGFATGASIHEATGQAVAVAVDCRNLKPVAKSLRAKFPDIEIVIAADDDQWKPENGNPGLEHATAAAKAVGGKLAIPKFKDVSSRPTDFNDLAQLCGLLEVKRCIEQAQHPATGDTGDTGDKPENKEPDASPVAEKEPGTPGTGFFINGRGVWFRGDKPEDPPLWICSPLTISAMTSNPDGEAWGRLLEFHDPDGRQHTWACPMELLAGDGSDFRRTLLSMGLQIAPSTKARQLLSNFVQSWKVKDRATCTNKTGWHGSAYVLPDETIGGSDERVLLQTLGEPPRLRQNGTVDEWRDHIARYCPGNSRLTLAVSAAFAAPLLDPLGDESGGLNFTGGSSTGKTTVLRAAASTWGGSEYLHRWRATGNGLEAMAQAHNDGLLVLDELAQVDPREAGEISYMLANGTGKHRARRDGLARKAATWRLLFLSAGEIGLADHMLDAGKKARAGQEVRLADVPADAGKGLGIFEELHSFPSAASLAEHLNQAVTKYHGTATRAYLRKLVQAPLEDMKKGIEKLRADFLAEKVPEGADGQARRVASRFALIAAAGELATRFGLTGWQSGAAIEGAAVCFRAWLDRRGGSGSQEETVALAQVRHFLEAHGEARFTDLDNQTSRPTINRAGYRRQTEAGLEYLILPEVFRQEVCGGLDYRQVARMLRDRGLLQSEAPDRLTIKPRGTGRVYCIREDRDES